MFTPSYRLAGHAVAAVLLAGVAVVATGGGAGAASAAASRPDSYGGDAAAAALQFQVDKQPFPFPVTDPFHTWVPYADTSIDSSGGSEGIASSVYPGQGVIGVPALICEFAAQLCTTPAGVPSYPDFAHAQYPAHPDDSAQVSQKPFPGSGPFEVTPNKVVAHADRDRVEAITTTGEAGVTGVVTVQSSTAHSLQQFQGSALVLTTQAVLKGVDIGGLLHIDQIVSTATAKIDGRKVGTSTANTTVSGATVAGQGVTIDSTGIHLANQSDNGLVKKTVNSALAKLASQNITVRSLAGTKSARPRKVTAQSGGLMVVAAKTVNGPALPGAGGVENGDYTIRATLGGAGVNAFAAPAVPLPNFQVPSVPSTTGSGAVPPPPSVGSGGSLPAQSTTTTPAGQQPAVAGSGQQNPVALPTDLTNKKLKTLALVLLAYPLLMLAAAPFRAPSRLPRAR
jgi:hypothetical protein